MNCFWELHSLEWKGGTKVERNELELKRLEISGIAICRHSIPFILSYLPIQKTSRTQTLSDHLNRHRLKS